MKYAINAFGLTNFLVGIFHGFIFGFVIFIIVQLIHLGADSIQSAAKNHKLRTGILNGVYSK